MIKAVPFKYTTGSEKFKEFLATPFEFKQLCSPLDDYQQIFDGWKVKDMVNWTRYTNDDNYVLEVYPTHYIIRQGKNIAGYQMPTPKTIDMFINHMDMFGIQLYYNDIIDELFEPKEYLHKDEIKQYFIDLLGKLDKSHELQ